MGLDPHTSAQSLNLKGPVRKVVNKGTSPGAIPEETVLFDRSGRVTEKIKRPHSGRDIERTLFRYDESGRLAGYDGYRNNTLDYSVAVKVGADGLMIELVRTHLSPSKQRATEWDASYQHKFDPRGRLSERIMELKNSIAPSGLLILSPGFPAGKYRETFRYEESGEGHEYVFYLPGPKGEVAFFRKLTSYDPAGRETVEVFPGGFSKGTAERSTYDEFRYNDHGEVVQKRHYEPINEATRREVGDRYKVDARGTVRNGILTSDKPNTVLWDLTECSYVYDQFKNWTTKTCTLTVSDGKRATGDPADDQQRSIEYYSQ